MAEEIIESEHCSKCGKYLDQRAWFTDRIKDGRVMSVLAAHCCGQVYALRFKHVAYPETLS
jgi:hypothetical protein